MNISPIHSRIFALLSRSLRHASRPSRTPDPIPTMPEPPPDFPAIQASVQAALLALTRTGTALAATDLPFQRSLDPAFGRALAAQNARLRALGERLLRASLPDVALDEGPAATGRSAVGLLGSDETADADAVDAIQMNWKAVVDVLDGLLERADAALDEFTGAVRRMEPEATGSGPPGKPPRQTGRSNDTYRLQDMEKPQARFEVAPDNEAEGPWKPILRTKPHAIVPLEESFETLINEEGMEQYQHPYQVEIERAEYPERIYQAAEPQPYLPFESTTATWVDTPEALDEMMKELRKAKEIAVDLEHHDARSYIGLVSLMQISTREKDWVVDTLKPWRRRLEVLNEVFTDPNIVKVLHGAYMDVVWLQRDFGLYLVNLFDTYHASRVLGYQAGSLAFLLQKFVHFAAQKQHQMADWRIRPLPAAMFEYARSDTHFLLYIFDHIRNDLVAADADPALSPDHIATVQEKSKATALGRFERPTADPVTGLGSAGWLRLLARTPALLTREQFSVFRAVHAWRDAAARAEDESPAWVLANHALLGIARAMPTTAAELWARVGTGASPVLRRRADEVVAAVREAKARGKEGPDMVEALKRTEGLLFPRREAAAAAVGTATRGPSTAETLRRILNVASKADAPESPAAPPPTTTTGDQARLKLGPATWAADSLRGLMSRFWGKSLGQASAPTANAPQRRDLSTAAVVLALPLPPLTAEVISEVPLPPSTPAVPSPSALPADPPTDDVFVIKHLGMHKANRKRKSDAISDAGTDGADAFVEGAAEVHVSDTDDSDAARRFRKAARASRKQAKKAKRAREAAAASRETDLSAEPFDYASAPSVLRPAPSGAEETSGGRKVLNPFRKGEGRKGEKKRRNVDGRSGTWTG